MAINRTDRLQGTQPLAGRTAGTRPLASAELARLEAPPAPAAMGTDQIAVSEAAASADRTDPLLVGFAGAGLAALTGSAFYNAVKDSLSVKKRVETIQKLTDNIDLRGSGSFRERMTQGARTYAANMNKPASGIKPLKGLDRASEAIRVVGGIQSALRLKSGVEALKDGATAVELANLAGDVMNSVRGADSLLKVAKGVKLGFIPMKLAPGLSAAAGAADAVRRIDKLSNWSELSTQDKVANVAYLAADVADIAGAMPLLFPFTKVLSAGLTLVGMAAENWSTIKNVAGKAADSVAQAIKEPGQAVENAVDTVKEAGQKVLGKIKGLFRPD